MSSLSSLASLYGSSYSTGLYGSALGTTNTTTGSTVPALSNYTQTGIAGVDGGYAYPPGSSMVQFRDNINNTAAAACMSPDGTQSVMDWANNLVNTSSSTTGTSSSSDSVSQLMSMLVSLLSSLLGGTDLSSVLGTTDSSSSSSSSSYNPYSSIYSYYSS